MWKEEFSMDFSSDGHLLKIDYATLTVNAGTPSIGIVTDNSYKSPLYDVQGVYKVERISENIGMVYSGYKPDYNPILKFARKTAQEYHLTKGEQIPVIGLVKIIGRLMQEYTQSAKYIRLQNSCSNNLNFTVFNRLRPFGISLLISGWYENSPYLFQCNPSGQYLELALADVRVGRNKIRDSNNDSTPKVCYVFCLTKLKVEAGNITGSNIEIGLCNKNGFKRFYSTNQFSADNFS